MFANPIQQICVNKINTDLCSLIIVISEKANFICSSCFIMNIFEVDSVFALNIEKHF